MFPGLSIIQQGTLYANRGGPELIYDVIRSGYTVPQERRIIHPLPRETPLFVR